MNTAKLAAIGRLLAVAGLILTTAACATVVGGTTQDVFIESEPAGAYCKVDRQGAVVGIVNPRPDGSASRAPGKASS